jgi:hypothetical protein
MQPGYAAIRTWAVDARSLTFAAFNNQVAFTFALSADDLFLALAGRAGL